MQPNTGNTLHDWKAADAEAREAERRLGEAWALFETGKAGPPCLDALYEVNRLRAASTYKLTQAMLQLSELAWAAEAAPPSSAEARARGADPALTRP
jgi:ferric-dicitrate binding protein FerR (iron transport regulator)